jgi:ABC-type branched-subunit amino acid transport system permease subunit
MTPRQQRIIGFAAFAAFVVFVLVLPQFVSDFKARDYSYVGIYLIALLGLNILTGYTGQISLGHGAFMAIGGYTTAILMAGNEQFGGPISGGVQDVWTLPSPGSSQASSGSRSACPRCGCPASTSRSRRSRSRSRCPRP